MISKKARIGGLSKDLSRFINPKVIALTLVGLLAVASGSGYAIYRTVSTNLPQITSLKNYKPPPGTQIFSEDDHVIGRLKVDKGIFVPFSQIPDSLKKAVVAVEDARFYEHSGVDIQGIMRAVLKDVLTASFKEGGSTITQQLAKVLFLTPEKSISRKFREMALARKIEQQLSKDEILELYLNKIYFGHGAYGVEMASRTYFGKHVGDLSLAESALIAGLIRSPMNYSPYNNMELAKSRQGTVLSRMVDEKFISRGQAEKAKGQPLVLKNLRAREEIAPHLVEQIRAYLEKTYGPDKVYLEGLNVKTTINYRLQLAAMRAVEDGLRNLDKRQGWRGPLSKKSTDDLRKLRDDPPAREKSYQPGEIITATVIESDATGATVSARGGKGRMTLKDMLWAGGKDADKKKASDILKPGYVIEVRVKGGGKSGGVSFSLEQEPRSQAALVAIDPFEGKVKAMVGGYDFQTNEFNHAINAHRQPGSAFKPFVYATAFESGFTPASLIDDTPRSYDNDSWKPQNYDRQYYGPTRLREALVQSRNVVTIELLHQVGVGNVLELTKKLGMTGPFANNLTLALGSGSATPVEMTAAYCSFANGGYSVEPVTVTQVTDRSGRVLEAHQTKVEQAFTPETAYQITSVLEDACRRGTAKSAVYLGRPVAGKTGTTNDYKDAWFVGYSPMVVAGVWVGNDDQKTLGRGESGARAALPIWMRFMGEALAGCPAEDFKVPDGIELVEVDADTGLLATGQSREVINECFKRGTRPQEYSSAPASSPASMMSIPEKLMPGIKEQRMMEDTD